MERRKSCRICCSGLRNTIHRSVCVCVFVVSIDRTSRLTNNKYTPVLLLDKNKTNYDVCVYVSFVMSIVRANRLTTNVLVCALVRLIYSVASLHT